jgi:hypothetical protein
MPEQALLSAVWAARLSVRRPIRVRSISATRSGAITAVGVNIIGDAVVN